MAIYPAAIPNDTDYPDRTDNVDWLYAARYNEIKNEILAICLELGISPSGASADVVTRLALLALKTNVLELDNVSAFTPDADYEPATKKYHDDNSVPTDSPTFTTKITTPIIDLTGGQIAFPATHAPSGGANTLDDYEEGTFTAELRGSVARANTPVEITGYYVKVGNLVTAHAYFENKDTTGASGQLQVVGLPFSALVSTAGPVGLVIGMNYTAGSNVACNINASTDTLVGYQFAADGSYAVWNITAGAEKYFTFSAAYRTY